MSRTTLYGAIAILVFVIVTVARRWLSKDPK